jgi:transposase-like protein
MHRIVSSITTLAQHIHVVEHSPEDFRPEHCPHCGLSVLWSHGVYHRKADRSGDRDAAGQSLNPVPICRYSCAGCRRTCSRLPLCIAPRRWYDWAVQQAVLQKLLNGWSLSHCGRFHGIHRNTGRRWLDWLRSRSEIFMFHLRSRLPEWGRIDAPNFWRAMPDGMSLAHAMAWLDREIDVP